MARRKQRRSSLFYYLPEEVVLKIFSSVPVKSLVRSTSVCKSWQSIISNPQFIRKHLTTYPQNQANSPAIFVRSKFLDEHVFICTPQDSTKVDLPPVQFPRYMCSCDGLVCLTTQCDDTVYIWNPSTRRFKMIPTPNKHANILRRKFSFVYDSISHDYKLIKFTVVILGNLSVFKVDMFSSNADSWKEILVPSALQTILTHTKSHCVYLQTGLIYVDCHSQILSFDCRNEVFGVFPFPNSYNRRSSVLDFQGSIAMIFDDDIDGSILSLWMLDDASSANSWTKMFNFEAVVGMDWISLYVDAGFVSKNGDNGYIVYDYKNKDIKEFLPQTDPSSDTQVPFSSVVRYTESLVSLKGFKTQHNNKGKNRDLTRPKSKKQELDGESL